MNKQCKFFLATVLPGFLCAGATDITSLTPGKLADMGIEPTETSMTLSGEMNAADFHFILDNMPNLQSLNLENVRIVAFSGPALPYTGLKTSSANTLPDYALTGLSKLTEVKLPSTLKAIGKGALSGTGIRRLEIPASVETIGDYAAMRCESLTTLIIAGSASLGTRAFANCPNLASVEITASVDEIPEGLFEACGGLQDIDLSKLTNCQNIGSWAFAECSGVETLILPPATVELAAGSLYGTSKIKSLALPSEVGSIGNFAMTSMNNLKELFVNNVERVPDLGEKVWANVDQTQVTLITPNNQADQYRNSDQWKEFNIITEEEWKKTQSGIDSAAVGSKSLKISYSNGQITISSTGNKLGKIALFNSAGMRMLITEGANDVKINVNGWPGGIYLVVTEIGAEKIAI